jgi:hypothetical protein
LGWTGTKVSFIVPDFAEFTSPVLPNGTNDLTLPAPEGDVTIEGEVICATRWGRL